MKRILPLLLLLAWVVPAAAEPLADYQIRLQTIREGLRAPANAENLDQVMGNARESLAQVAEVSLPSGEQVRVDNSELISELEQATHERDANGKREKVEGIAARMDSLAGAISLYQQVRQGEALGPSTQQAAARLRQVLSRREFRQSLAERGLSALISRIFQFVMRLLARILEAAGKAARVVGWLFLGAGLLGVMLMAISLAIRITQAGKRAPKKPEAESQPAAQEGPATEDEALSDADAALKRGNYRDALRSLYRALLLFLARQGAINYGRGITNWEYVRTVRAASTALAEPLAASTVLFEPRWYGSVPATPADYEALMNQYAALRRKWAGDKDQP